MTGELIQILFTLLGAVVGLYFAPILNRFLAPYPEYYGFVLIVLVFTSIGFLIGFFLDKRLKLILKKFDELLSSVPGIDLIVGTIGLLTGLVVALLVSVPFIDLPYGRLYTLISFFFFGFLGLVLSLLKSREIAYYLVGKKYFPLKKVVDTSALIDGRIVALLKNNLLEGVLILPKEVLKELKLLADSQEIQKRKKGQRGLKVLEEITENYSDRIMEYETNSLKPVDELLVEICLKEGAGLVTADSNLAMLAKAMGIQVVSLNQLQNDLRLPVEVGEHIRLKLVRRGKNPGQAVGYLDDGTMVVVESAEELIGQEIEAVIKGITLSHTGRVIFAERR
jgi:uncharacterized protein YacL